MSKVVINTEDTPLLSVETANTAENASDNQASVSETSLNIAKMCMGVGTMALPFAASEGGLISSTIGIALLSLWNIYCVDRLLMCTDLISSITESPSPSHRRTLSSKRRYFQRTPSQRVNFDECEDDCIMDKVKVDQCPQSASTYSKVAWQCFGPAGIHLLDVSMILLLFGVIISYLEIVMKLMADTPFTTGSSVVDVIIAVLIILPLAYLPDIGLLAKFSAMGLFAILFSFVVIFGYGIKANGLSGFEQIKWSDMWPRSMAGLSKWFGACVYSFGIAPLTYNVRESMASPQFMLDATRTALYGVVVCYWVISDVIKILYSANDTVIRKQILSLLPNTWIAFFVRVSMSVMSVVTVPLLVIPCGDLIAGKFGVGEKELAESSPESETHKHLVLVRNCARSFVTVLAGVVSVYVPDFVSVVSFIGSCCVAVVSFVFPPLFYIVLFHKERSRKAEENGQTSLYSSTKVLEKDKDVERNRNAVTYNECFSTCFSVARELFLDYTMLTLGVIISAIASYLTFFDILAS